MRGKWWYIHSKDVRDCRLDQAHCSGETGRISNLKRIRRYVDVREAKALGERGPRS